MQITVSGFWLTSKPSGKPLELAIGKLRQGNLSATIHYTVGQEQAKFRGGNSAFLDSIFVLNRPF